MTVEQQLNAMENTITGLVAALAALCDLDKERCETIARIVSTLKLQQDTIERLTRGVVG